MSQCELLPPEAFSQNDRANYLLTELLADSLCFLPSSTFQEEIRKFSGDAIFKKAYDRFIPKKHELENFKKKAKAGSKISTLKVACYYLFEAEQLDIPTVIHWLEMAANVGHPWSQYILARFLADENAPWGDTQKAYVWIFNAAATGFEPAIAIRDQARKELTEEELRSVKKGMKEWYDVRRSAIRDANS